MEISPLRTGLIGAGYIASWHAAALKSVPGVRLAAICDVNRTAAAALAGGYGVPAFTSLEEMLAAKVVDAVHILTPPPSHAPIALDCLKAGLHVLVEKPAGINAQEASSMASAASAAGRQIAVGHNFLALPAYERLKALRDAGRLGRIASVEIRWCLPLAPLRSGPFDLWLIREPRNLLLELGPHLYAFAYDLFGPIDIQHVELGMPIDLPGGGTRHQSWRILARAKGVEVTFMLSLVETFDDRSVTLRGSGGEARFDMAHDTLEVRVENANDIILNPLAGELSLAWQHFANGLGNAGRQLSSLNRKSPYGLSFQRLCESFYAAVRRGGPIDPRFSMDAAEHVMEAIGKTLDQLPPLRAPATVRRVEKRRPTVMVIGGTGFLGRNLTRALVASGRDVRVVSRGHGSSFADLADRVETVSVSLRDHDELVRSMDGIETVYNLAKSTDHSWEEALRNDVAVSTGIAKAALEAGVGRLIYTGTIASYDMSDPSRVISEETGFATDMTDRNIYARSKAECEARLLALHREQGLPLVIARPGIVVGERGPLQHWGIGRWSGPGAIRLWGNGRNILPFVLVGDVADALIRMMETDNILGESFNLVGEAMFSARDYFDAIHKSLGARIVVKPGSLYGLYLLDGIKYALKRHVLHNPGAVRASLRDWQSRAHLSPFANAKAKARLAWKPEADRDVFIAKAIEKATLLGF
ncbi:NAD-dependent epimerase/dehydratase family protein [Solirhodobacter olei]|uniref:NAD-dependent epimerase/dehydratase family protein n=1 Tax=Solirhodobacter olei TaxID=2493082 RepID=UPI000FD74298|nr:NAD-dependent epimerase/dehydratase family protein [Solirhodobacter olei]